MHWTVSQAFWINDTTQSSDSKYQLLKENLRPNVLYICVMENNHLPYFFFPYKQSLSKLNKAMPEKCSMDSTTMSS